MKAWEARREVDRLEEEDRNAAQRKKEEEQRAKEERDANAEFLARRWYDGSITDAIKKAVVEKKNSISISFGSDSPKNDRVFEELCKILVEESYKFNEPYYHENSGHDADWGEYDFSCWYLDIRW